MINSTMKYHSNRKRTHNKQIFFLHHNSKAMTQLFLVSVLLIHRQVCQCYAVGRSNNIHGGGVNGVNSHRGKILNTAINFHNNHRFANHKRLSIDKLLTQPRGGSRSSTSSGNVSLQASIATTADEGENEEKNGMAVGDTSSINGSTTQIERKPKWPCGDELDQMLIKISLPCIANFAINPLVGAVDLFWINRMGNTLAVAGQAAANQIFSSSFWLTSFLPSGEFLQCQTLPFFSSFE